jgi:hypothetical protein
MSTLWWLVVVALTGLFTFAAGWAARAEWERYYRHVYDIDFTHRRVGL